MDSHWRRIAAPIIAKVIAEVGTDDPKALRQALRDAYPFGQRSLWPYRVWRHEIRRQLTGESPIIRRKIERQQAQAEAAGQLSLLP